MHKVVFTLHPSINMAYQKSDIEEIGVSLTSVYNKINGVETTTSSELVKYSASETRTLIEEIGGGHAPWDWFHIVYPHNIQRLRVFPFF